MKCEGCEDKRIMFTIIPDISDDVAWASHIISDDNGHLMLYHYQCSNADIISIYDMYNEMSGSKSLIRHKKPI